jgi:hypothetical protein
MTTLIHNANPNAGHSVETSGRKFSKARPLARQVGLHPKTLFRLAEAGKISAFRVNSRLVLFDEAEVVGLIEAGRTGGREQ